MAGSSVSRLVDLLSDSELLRPDQGAQLADLQKDFPEPRALAKALIERGWLTPYQVQALLRGQAEELCVGPYVVLDVVGKGAMGDVFKARHRQQGHVVALKVIRTDQQDDPKALRRFRRELRALTRLSHPNIVTARDISDSDRTRFFAMEYVEGVNLYDVIRECGPLPLAPAVDYVRQSALGLQHAYEKGLIHRDIKPSNLLLTPLPAPAAAGVRAGRWGVVKLLDLGLALLQQKPGERTDSHCRLTSKGAMLGTVDYMAPEQVMNPSDVDIRADLYSLGCTLYEMLAGRPPFAHVSPGRKLVCHQEVEPVPVEQLRPGLPAEAALVVRKLMAKAPADRFQAPAHLAATLTTLLNRLEPADVDWDWQPPHLDAFPAAADLRRLTHGDGGRRWGPVLLAGVGLAVLGGAGLLLWLW